MLGEGVVIATEKDRQKDIEGGRQKPRVRLPEVQPLRWGQRRWPPFSLVFWRTSPHWGFLALFEGDSHYLLRGALGNPFHGLEAGTDSLL